MLSQYADDTQLYSGGVSDPVGPGVLTPSLFGSGGPNVHRPPLFSAMLLYIAIVSVLLTVAELCMHAHFCSTLNINVDFVRLFDCENCVKMFGQRVSRLCPDSLGIRECYFPSTWTDI